MARDLYEALRSGKDPGGDEPIGALLLALSAEAALRRAAAELAEAELHEGFWAEEDEAPEGAQRLAAEDEDDEEPLFVGKGYRVRLRFKVDGSARVIQEAGPGGLTLVAADSWLPLQPGVSTRLPQPLADAWSAEVPEALELLDASGKRLRLSRRGR